MSFMGLLILVKYVYMKNIFFNLHKIILFVHFALYYNTVINNIPIICMYILPEKNTFSQC